MLIVNRIRDLRKEKGLTLDELSKELQEKEKIKIGSNALGKYERGEREPKLKTWIKMSEYFSVPVSYLQGVSEYRTNLSDLSNINTFVKFMNDVADGKKENGDLFFTEETWQKEINSYMAQKGLENFKELVNFFNKLGITEIKQDDIDKLLNNISDIFKINHIIDETFFFFETCIAGYSGDKEKMKLVNEFNSKFEEIEKNRNPDDWY